MLVLVCSQFRSPSRLGFKMKATYTLGVGLLVQYNWSDSSEGEIIENSKRARRDIRERIRKQNIWPRTATENPRDKHTWRKMNVLLESTLNLRKDEIRWRQRELIECDCYVRGKGTDHIKKLSLRRIEPGTSTSFANQQNLENLELRTQQDQGASEYQYSAHLAWFGSAPRPCHTPWWFVLLGGDTSASSIPLIKRGTHNLQARLHEIPSWGPDGIVNENKDENQ